jgi:enamine deaminase RidA (YjgF/YER057c/UK114 family)
LRGLESEVGREIYITARPDPTLPLPRQGRETFAGIRDVLEAQQAWICQERIFAPAGALEILGGLRAQVYGDWDDGVAPTWLVGGPDDAVRGVQVYAVALGCRPRPLASHGRLRGRLIQINGCRWVTASALPTRQADTGEAQTRLALEEAEALLKQAGADMTSAARIWFYLDHILDWYGSFNDTRSRFFAERGLLGPHLGARFPASTGIGVRPAGDTRCLMDMIAVVGDPVCPHAPAGCVCKHQAAGMQRSAYEYGSSFARAATVCTPAGRTVFVSGTAAINATGATCHLGNIPGQIRMTIECIYSVLNELRCFPHDVVQAIAYCKTPEVEACFRKWQREVPWPWIVVRGDVCRANLLFEAEVAACVGAKELAL